MSTTLTTERRHRHPPHLERTRTLTPADRLALRLGVALIRWSRRAGASSERRATRLERAIALGETLRRRDEQERRLLLQRPPR